MNFLQNVNNKEVFKVYKYTKPRIVEKLPPIQYENNTHVSFQGKCNAFYNAMYSKNSFSNDEINLNDYSEHDNQFKWENIEEKEIQKAIFIFLLLLLLLFIHLVHAT